MTKEQVYEIKRLATKDAGWNVMRDNIALALDQIDTGQRDLQGTRELVMYLRSALKIAHVRLEALEKRA